MTLVVINTGKEAKDIKLAGANLPEKFTLYRTSATEDCTDLGAVPSSGTVSLPGRTVTTLYGSF